MLRAPTAVARRSGAAEKLVMLSNAKRVILCSGYLVVPATRSPRSYVTWPEGKPSEGMSRR